MTIKSLPATIRELHSHPGLLHGSPPHIDSILWLRIEMLARRAEQLIRVLELRRAAASGLRNLTPPQHTTHNPTMLEPGAWVVFGD